MDMIFHAIMQATLVSKLVLALLLFMSLVSWAYMLGKWLCLRKVRTHVLHGLDVMDSDDLLESLAELERYGSSPLYGITRRGVREFNRISRIGDAERLMNDNVRRALHFGIAHEMALLRSSLSLLATTASTAPFIGLFGTVWGIMYSFQSIAVMKSVSIATVAPGIAEALIATAVGLFVAIPATWGFNMFRAGLSAIENECITFAGQLLNRMQHEAGHHTGGLSFGEGK